MEIRIRKKEREKEVNTGNFTWFGNMSTSTVSQPSAIFQYQYREKGFFIMLGT